MLIALTCCQQCYFVLYASLMLKRIMLKHPYIFQNIVDKCVSFFFVSGQCGCALQAKHRPFSLENLHLVIKQRFVKFH